MFTNPSVRVSLAVVVLGCFASVAQAQDKCWHENFVVQDTSYRRESVYLALTGKLVNMGASACGVQLRASVYAKDNTVLDTATFWPASVRNIEPGASEPFKYMLRFDARLAKYDIVPVDARQWPVRR